MSRYQGRGRLALAMATLACALAGCASVGRYADIRVPAEQRPGIVGNAGGMRSAGSALVGAPYGWPEEVPLPPGAQIDGYQCTDRYCVLWFSIMDYDSLMAFRKNYIKQIKDSGKFEQLGSPFGLYENEAFRYTGAMQSGCGYTLEVRQGSITYKTFRLSLSVFW
jgi:hypothetical protein